MSHPASYRSFPVVRSEPRRSVVMIRRGCPFLAKISIDVTKMNGALTTPRSGQI
jgi:hypothetical protein